MPTLQQHTKVLPVTDRLDERGCKTKLDRSRQSHFAKLLLERCKQSAGGGEKTRSNASAFIEATAKADSASTALGQKAKSGGGGGRDGGYTIVQKASLLQNDMLPL